MIGSTSTDQNQQLDKNEERTDESTVDGGARRRGWRLWPHATTSVHVQVCTGDSKERGGCRFGAA